MYCMDLGENVSAACFLVSKKTCPCKSPLIALLCFPCCFSSNHCKSPLIALLCFPCCFSCNHWCGSNEDILPTYQLEDFLVCPWLVSISVFVFIHDQLSHHQKRPNWSLLVHVCHLFIRNCLKLHRVLSFKVLRYCVNKSH